MSQELSVQNIPSSSNQEWAVPDNLFNDVALVRSQLDCLGMSYNPDSIANMLLEYDNSERVAIVINRIIDDCLPDVGITFESSSTNETSVNETEESGISYQVEKTSKIREKLNRTDGNGIEPPAVDLTSPDDEPSPCKLSKPTNPQKNPFSHDLLTQGDSFKIKDLPSFSGAPSISSKFEESFKSEGKTSNVKKMGNLSSAKLIKKSELEDRNPKCNGSDQQHTLNGKDPQLQSSEISHILESVSSSLKIPISRCKISSIKSHTSDSLAESESSCDSDKMDEITDKQQNVQTYQPKPLTSELSENNHSSEDPQNGQVSLMDSVDISEQEISTIDSLVDFFTLSSGSSSSKVATFSGESASASNRPNSLKMNSGISSVEPIASSSKNTSEPMPKYLANLMEVFPDADTAYLRELCKQTTNKEKYLSENATLSLAELIDTVLNNPDYPRRNLPNVEESEATLSSDEKFQNVMAILPDIDPAFAEQKCSESANVDEYNLFVNTSLSTGAYPTIKDARRKETGKTIKAYIRNPTVPDFVQVFPDPEDYFMNKKISSHHEHSLAFLKDRFKLLRADDIAKVYKSEKSNLTRSFFKLDSHRGPFCKRRRNALDCKWPPKNDVNFLQETFYIENREEIHDYVKAKKKMEEEAFKWENSYEFRNLRASGLVSRQPTENTSWISSPPLAAFGLFLRLPDGYADILDCSGKHAQSILKSLLDSTNGGEKTAGHGDDTQSSSLGNSLQTQPFEELERLLASSSLTTDCGIYIRKIALDQGVVHLILSSLAALTHFPQYINLPGSHIQLSTASTRATNKTSAKTRTDESYWAKGTGYGTGSTAQSWNIKQALSRQKWEESQIATLIQVLSSFINPQEEAVDFSAKRSTKRAVPKLSPSFHELLQKSCLLPALSSYLRNDSVLDMARHIPLYRAIFCLLRAIASNDEYVELLFPNSTSNQESSISSLLLNVKKCVDIYSANVSSKISKAKTEPYVLLGKKSVDQEEEELASLIADIQRTALLISAPMDRTNKNPNSAESLERPLKKTVEERYLEFMKALQFDSYDMIVENCDSSGIKFTVSHHYETSIRAHGDGILPARFKRLAQEVVTLRTSLPLSYSSSVFVRCDSDRLDVMKVLITGPADTPYMNGCFEFDVYFPRDYPSSPMQINLETTGQQSVRFNPNLYNDGKVCLSILNTWNGRPEEKWNAQTSSTLQVLVSIQSLILVSEPYFNEPGYESTRGSTSGSLNSRKYNMQIRQATVKWAMINQLKNPSPCFKDVIQSHFWIKRYEICSQIARWIEEADKDKLPAKKSKTDVGMSLRSQLQTLRNEIAKLTPPAGLEDLVDDVRMNAQSTSNRGHCSKVLPQAPAVSQPSTSSKSSTSWIPFTSSKPPIPPEPTQPSAQSFSEPSQQQEQLPFTSDYASDSEFEMLLAQLVD